MDGNRSLPPEWSFSALSSTTLETVTVEASHIVTDHLPGSQHPMHSSQRKNVNVRALHLSVIVKFSNDEAAIVTFMHQ